MRKIEWKSEGSDQDVTAKIGLVMLHCSLYFTSGSKRIWRANTSIKQIAATTRYGPIRHSLSKAKIDAIRLACELLLDYHASIVAEMKNFDLSDNDE